jgi:hypothetical protein
MSNLVSPTGTFDSLKLSYLLIASNAMHKDKRLTQNTEV